LVLHKNERNFRVHILAALTVVLLSPYYGFSPEQGVLIAIVIALVLICEMFNTALEAMVDLETTEYNELARKQRM
jgi:diacylglycerol kinase (ATP)